MIQRLPGAFREVIPNAPSLLGGPIQDELVLLPALTSARSDGATQIDTITPTQQINQKWQLQSIAVTASLWMEPILNDLFGLLGKIIVGITLPTSIGNTQQTQTIGPNALPWISPMLAFPDPSLTFDLWNPVVDPLPPQFDPTNLPLTTTPPNKFLPISGQLQLPQYIDLTSGEQIGIGIWITPSLLGSNAGDAAFNMGLSAAQWVITYDDGL